MRLTCLVLLVALFQVLVGLPEAIQVQEAKRDSLTDPKELEAFLDSLFAEQMKKLHIHGAAIAVVNDGKIGLILW